MYNPNSARTPDKYRFPLDSESIECAEKAGYHPEIILAGQRINDGMGERIARECMRALLQRGRANPTVTILGMTFKENVPDIRNSKVIDILRELVRVGISVQVADPIASAEETADEYGIKLTPRRNVTGCRCDHFCRCTQRVCRRRVAIGHEPAQGAPGYCSGCQSKA
jgi:UDP-glucose 6-dehydrogenase